MQDQVKPVETRTCFSRKIRSELNSDPHEEMGAAKSHFYFNAGGIR